MGKFQNLSGQKFSRLTVVKIGYRDKRKTIKWECLCDCGKTTYVSTYHLKCGEIKSCGCYHDEAASTNNSLNIVGDKYGRLTVLERLGRLKNKGLYIWWRCKCDCGNEMIATTGGLRSGNPRSCGCLKIEATKAMCGPKHPNWNPNKSDKDREYEKKYRRSSQHAHQKWAKSIKERDNYTCCICNQHGGRLRSHHIKGWMENTDLRFDLDNGVCMCYACHQKFHKKYKYKGNSLEQIMEFKKCFKEV